MCCLAPPCPQTFGPGKVEVGFAGGVARYSTVLPPAASWCHLPPGAVCLSSCTSTRHLLLCYASTVLYVELLRDGSILKCYHTHVAIPRQCTHAPSFDAIAPFLVLVLGYGTACIHLVGLSSRNVWDPSEIHDPGRPASFSHGNSHPLVTAILIHVLACLALCTASSTHPLTLHNPLVATGVTQSLHRSPVSRFGLSSEPAPSFFLLCSRL